jgi:hypothetical protein
MRSGALFATLSLSIQCVMVLDKESSRIAGQASEAQQIGGAV